MKEEEDVVEGHLFMMAHTHHIINLYASTTPITRTLLSTLP